MKKKTQMILWIILAVVMIATVGLLATNIVLAKTHDVKNPVATFEIENYGNIKIELYPEYAPNTVLNFINLINKGYYNGKTFYGKDVNAIYAAKTQEGEFEEPKMNLVNSSIEADIEYQIDGEFVANGFENNTLKHERGTISMVREEYASYFGLTEQGYNSASSHFQIMLEQNRSLNGLYTGFGKVIEGLDIVEKIFAIEEAKQEAIEGEETAEDNENAIKNLSAPAIIKNAKVETFGVEYDIPKVHEAFDYEAYLQNYFNSYSN